MRYAAWRGASYATQRKAHTHMTHAPSLLPLESIWLAVFPFEITPIHTLAEQIRARHVATLPDRVSLRDASLRARGRTRQSTGKPKVNPSIESME